MKQDPWRIEKIRKKASLEDMRRLRDHDPSTNWDENQWEEKDELRTTKMEAHTRRETYDEIQTPRGDTREITNWNEKEMRGE